MNESQRVKDSMAKAKLTAQINSLKSTDNLKNEELQKQLQELNEKENERLRQKKEQIDTLRLTARGYPVLGYFNDTLFSIYSRPGSFTAADRASAVTRRIQNLSSSLNFKPDSLKISSSENTDDLVFDGNIIISISENDAIWENTTKDSLAQKYKKIVGEEVLRYKSATSLATLLKEIGLAILILVLIIALIKYLFKFFRWNLRWIIRQEGKIFNGIKIRNYTLFNARRQVRMMATVNSVLKWVIL